MLYRCIDQYLKKYAKKYSIRSVEVKAYSLYQFLDYLTLKGIESWHDCDQKIIRNYIVYRSQQIPKYGKKLLAASSMQTQLASIRVFFDYLVDNKLMMHNPAKLVRPPKTSKHLPKVIEIDILARILNKEPINELEIRDLAICELLYSSGLRLSEIEEINCQDLSLQEREISIKNGKGGKARNVPVGSKAILAVRKWYQVREKWLETRPLERHVDALFISQQGNRLCARQISNRVKRFASKAGVNVNMHPHLLRHSMATHILESSQDIRLVQELLGHADISTTQVYTHLDFGHLTKIFDQSHPRAKKNRTKKKPQE